MRCTVVVAACVLLPLAAAFQLPATPQVHRGLSPSLTALRCKDPSVGHKSLPTRRDVLQGLQQSLPPLGAAAGLLGAKPALAEYGSDVVGGLELIIPQQALLGALVTAPVKNVIITGANSGVGMAAAKLLTAAGHHVTLACRTQAKADAAAAACMEYAASSTDAGPATGKAGFYAGRRAGGVAVGAECDLSSLASVRAFAESVKGKPLDMLSLNAGLSLNVGEKGEQFTADNFELTVGTNHLGHFLLYNLLRPTLAKGVNPRLVVTASGVHDPASEGGKQGGPDKWASMGEFAGLEAGKGFSMVDGGKYDPDKAYKDSKLCNMLFMAEAARREEGTITANAFSPGLIADPKGFFRNQNPIFAKLFYAISQIAGVGENNDFAGSALAYMAVGPDLAGKTGGWYDALPLGKHSLAKHSASTEAQDVAKQAKLWQLSTKLVGLDK